MVYLVDEGKAVQRVVQTGVKQGDLIEITAGLTGGETIAVDGAGFLTNNASIAVARPPGEPGATPTARRPSGGGAPPPAAKGGAS